MRALKCNSAHLQLLSECRSNKDFKICRDVLIPLHSAGKKKKNHKKSLFLPLTRCARRGILINSNSQSQVLQNNKKILPTQKCHTNNACKVLASSPPMAF